MNNTREKLLEAKYFLERMIRKQSHRDAFKYNLSAFLAAARSVTFFMQKEFARVSGFKEWYSKKQAEMQSNNAMRFLNKKREMTIHQQPVRPYAQVNTSNRDHVRVSESISILITHANGAIERRESEPTPTPVPAENEVTTKGLWYFDELPEKDVVTLSKEYIVKLETLVTECESRFTS